MFIGLQGPSGAGKTTLGERVLSSAGARHVISTTDRAPRPGEVDGKHYRFISAATMDDWIKQGRFAELIPAGKARMVILRMDLEAAMSNPAGIGWETLWADGARQLQQALGPRLLTVGIFVTPRELERRLRLRGDSDSEVAWRMERNRAELAALCGCDRMVDNTNLQEAERQLVAILADIRSTMEAAPR